MSKSSSKPKNNVDSSQKQELLKLATKLIAAFPGGLVSSDHVNPFANDEFGFSFFEGFIVHYTKPFLEARAEFTRHAAKILKAKAAHEPTIITFSLKAAQRYVVALAGNEGTDVDDKALKAEAQSLVDTVLEELSKIYTHIEANFLVVHDNFEGLIELGRVRSMTAEDAATHTPLSGITKIQLSPGHYGEEFMSPDGYYIVGMPRMVWVVDVPAAKENVTEEAKWLIDVAVSLMRLSSPHWSVRRPKNGEVEPHPVRPASSRTPHVTFHGDMSYTGSRNSLPVYDINSKVAADLQSASCQKIAQILFDAPNKSLALRVAQGLGWLTRGRQMSDRSERLLAFFTALEALLTSSDKSDPVTQTISRHVSVIYTQKLPDRMAIYNRVKVLYGLRSAVVHSGKREVLWQDVNTLQSIAEAVFFVVLKRCDLTMSQDTFSQSLADASHGLPWVFAKRAAKSRKKPTS